MKPQIISRQKLEELGKKYGHSPMPKDHPVHLEGPSIILSSRTPKQPQKKGVPLSPAELPTSAATGIAVKTEDDGGAS